MSIHSVYFSEKLCVRRALQKTSWFAFIRGNIWRGLNIFNETQSNVLQKCVIAEDKKEEPKEESDEDMGFGLFD